MIKGVIFDFNGVLWWDTELQEESWRRFSAAKRGYPLTEEEMLNKMHGVPNAEVMAYIMGRKIEGQERLDLIQEKESYYRNSCVEQGENFKLSPGAIEFLDMLVEKNIPHTIATASEKTNLDFFIKYLSLEKWFDLDKIIFDDGTFPGKPAPDMYLKAARNLNLDPKDCMVIEDSKSGLASAYAAGIGRIVALGPKEKHEMLRSLPGVTDVVENIGQINL